MSKPLVRYSCAVSLDGFIAPEDGSHHWLDDSAGGAEFFEFLKTIGGIVMGRATFEQSLSFGPWDWTQPTVVMTTRPFEKPLPEGVEAFGGDPAVAVKRLSARMTGGDIWLFGGGKTAARFLEADLIDRMEFAVVPTALGKGIPLFDGANTARKFRLESARASADGLAMLNYARVSA